MKSRLNTYPTPNFQARQIAKAYIKGKSNQCVELYSLHSSDKIFGTKLSENLDLKKLYPNESCYDEFRGWDAIILNALGNIGYQDVILAIHNKRPCGIMSYNQDDNQVNLSYLAKWRPSPNKDVSYVGKILMHHLFDTAHEDMQWNISLSPSRYTPRGKDCKDFYSQLGFRYQGRNNIMNLFAVDYSEKAKELEKYFEYKKIKNAPNINPEKVF